MSSTPFDAEAPAYDDAFTRSTVGRLARARFWRCADAVLLPGMRVLELGGGTGEDACHFAERGVRITYTDASEGMRTTATRKFAARGLEGQVAVHPADMNALADATLPGAPFDAAYANFGAVNCVTDLPAFAAALAGLLKPGAPVLLTVMGPLCPWEWRWYGLRGEFRRAFRRLTPGGVEWRGLRVQYPGPKRLTRALRPHFEPVGCRVVNAFLPPSYVEAAGYPEGRLERLDGLDERFQRHPFAVRLADHYLAHLTRR